MAGLLFLAICLGVKSYWLDAWNPHDSQENAWSAIAQTALAEEPDSWFHKKGILMDRTVSIKEKPSDEPGDPSVLKITIRSYVGGYLPIGDRNLTVPLKDKDIE